MKKVKPKKRNGTQETEGKALQKKAEDNPTLAVTPKARERSPLKKPGVRELSKEGTQEGLVAKWKEKTKVAEIIDQVKQFLREVRIELKKVTWPSRKETIAATIMVIILSILVAFFLGILDVVLAKVVSSILKG